MSRFREITDQHIQRQREIHERHMRRVAEINAEAFWMKAAIVAVALLALFAPLLGYWLRSFGK